MPPTKHIVAFGRILFVLLLVANSGFTMVLHTCQMPDMSCCDPSERTYTGTGGDDHNRTLAFTSTPSVCCQLEVVGGVDSGAQELNLAGLTPPSPLALCTVFSNPSTAFPLFSEGARPYTVASYILNASLLI
jgi:hypothetical protein